MVEGVGVIISALEKPTGMSYESQDVGGTGQAHESSVTALNLVWVTLDKLLPTELVFIHIHFPYA